MAKKLVDYKQTDSKWAKKPYRVKGKESATIGGSGCGPTCAAMIVATYEYRKETPVTACNWSMKHGYKAVNQGTFYSFFEPYFKAHGMKCTQVPGGNSYHKRGTESDKKALAALKEGKYVIACMGPGLWTSSGHFVVLRAYKDGYIYIQDPASSKKERLKNTWDNVSYQAKYYWIIEAPDGRIMYTKDKLKVYYNPKKGAKIVGEIGKGKKVITGKISTNDPSFIHVKGKKWGHEWVKKSKLKDKNL